MMERIETIAWTSVKDSLPDKAGEYLCEIEMKNSGTKMISIEQFYNIKEKELKKKNILFKETDELTFTRHPAYSVTYWADVKGPS